MSLIVDASVALKWYVDEPHSNRAAQLLDREDLIAPELIVSEIANAFWKRIRRDESSFEQAAAALEQLPIAFRELFPTPPLGLPALMLAADNDHPVYDCLYLALAEREGAPLVTADRRLASLARSRGIETEAIGT